MSHPMFIGISSNVRRATLKMALNQFLEIQPQMPMGQSAEKAYAELCAEARRLLREISASENLMVHRPPTHAPTEE
jgi:hypothetical protein